MGAGRPLPSDAEKEAGVIAVTQVCIVGFSRLLPLELRLPTTLSRISYCE